MLEPTLEMAWDADTNGTARWLQGWSDGLATYMVIATDTKLWFWKASSASSGAWVDATRPSGDYPVGQWQSFEWGDTVIFNNGQTAPQIFNQSTLKFEDLPNWGLISSAADIIDSSDPSSDTDARCTCILPYKSFLVALGVTERGTYQPNTVWWSDSTPLVGYNTGVNGTGGPPDWDYESPASLSGKAEVGAGNGALKWGAVLNENLICYTDASATAMQAVGGRQVMSFRRLFNKGCAGLHLAVEYNNQHYVVARDQIYIHDGSSVKLIAKDRVEDEFFKRAGKAGRFGGDGSIDFTSMQLVKNPDRKEIILLFNETYDNWGPAEGCEPYACDAMRTALAGLADSVWPAETQSGGITPEYSGGTGIPIELVAGVSFFDADPVITSACYTSYGRNDIGQGNSISGAVYAVGGSGSGSESIGMIVRFNSATAFNGIGHEFIARQLDFRINGTPWLMQASVYNSTSPYTPGLTLSIESAQFSTGSQLAHLDWSTIGSDPSEAHWIQLNVTWALTGGPGAWAWSVSADVYVDGVLRISNSRSGTGSTGGTITLGGGDAVWFAGDANDGYANNLYYADGKLSAAAVEELVSALGRNQLGYTPPAYCSNVNQGNAYIPTQARGALVYNFEDDNYTWMDASVDSGTALVDVACMTYAFNPGWAVRWSDLATEGSKWDGSVGTTLTTTTVWSDFYSHGTEKNLYWLAADGVYRSDQAVKTDGVKDYYVVRYAIDLDDMVPQWTTNKFKHLSKFYFHLESPTPVTGANNFDLTVGWGKNLMDSPDWTTQTTVSLQTTANTGAYKADLRTTGRYLSFRMDFDGTDEIAMTGGDLDVEESHGR